VSSTPTSDGLVLIDELAQGVRRITMDRPEKPDGGFDDHRTTDHNSDDGTKVSSSQLDVESCYSRAVAVKIAPWGDRSRGPLAQSRHSPSREGVV